jgi:cytochrome P450
VLSRFADCEAVLADPAFGRIDEYRERLSPARPRAAGRRQDDPVSAGSLLRLNPPDHTRLRRLVSRAFTPARVRELAPRVEELTAELLAAELLPSRRRSPGGDLISALAGVQDSGGSLTEDELVGLCMLLLVAGHETTRSLIGGAVLALLRHPAELAALAADPSLADQAVEEVLRYDPPVQVVSRSALRSTEIAGITVAAGSFVLMLLGAANRDPVLCADPDQFSVRRGARRHLAFGHGIHFCLGAPLARLEAAIALRQLLPLLPRLRIAGEPEWKPNTVLRGLEHLWLERADAARPPAPR